MGLSQGCVLPGTQTLLARWVPPSERARLGEQLFFFFICFDIIIVEKVFRLKVEQKN